MIAIPDPWQVETLEHHVTALKGYHPDAAAALATLERFRDARRSTLRETVLNLSLIPASAVGSSIRNPACYALDDCRLPAAKRLRGAHLLFDPEWITSNLQRLLKVAEGYEATDFPYPTPSDVSSIWWKPGSVQTLIKSQLADWLKWIAQTFTTRSGTYALKTDSHFVQCSKRHYDKHDVSLMYQIHRGAEREVVLCGDIQDKVSLTLEVLRWMVWWARNGYEFTYDTPEKASGPKAVALRILRLVWEKQVTQRARRLYITNGDHFIFITPTGRVLSCSSLSRIYNYDGDFDPYDGSAEPRDSTSRWQTRDRESPHVPGLLAALTLGSLSSEATSEPLESPGSHAMVPIAPDQALSGQHDDPTGRAGDEPIAVSSADPAKALVLPGTSEIAATPKDDALLPDGSARDELESPPVLAKALNQDQTSPVIDAATSLADSETSSTNYHQPSRVDARHPHPRSTAFRDQSQILASLCALCPSSLNASCSPASDGEVESEDTTEDSDALSLMAVSDIDNESILSDDSGETAPIIQAQIQFDAYLDSGTLGDVYGGSMTIFGDTLPCAFKFVHSDTFKDRYCRSLVKYSRDGDAELMALAKEADKLKKLCNCSGVVRLYGLWKGLDVDGHAYSFIAMEKLDSRADAKMSEQDKEGVLDCLKSLHKAGKSHGSLRLSHYLRSANGGWRCVDLERSEAINHSKRRSEIGLLRSLLGMA